MKGLFFKRKEFILFLCSIFIFLQEGIASSIDSFDHRIPKTSSSIKVDGKLQEDFWKDALKLELNFEWSPGENIPPPVNTEIFLIYSSSNLYVGVKAYDPEPSKILAHFTDRDKIWGDDVIGIVFDTYNDERRCFNFFCNPFGIQLDAIEGKDSWNENWDAIWYSNGRITDEGYIIEMSFPFSSLRFQRKEGEQIWGLDVVRTYPRSVNHQIGLFARDRNNDCYLCQAPKIIGFEGAVPGHSILVNPVVTGQATQERENGTTGPFLYRDKKAEPSLTIKWGLTPNVVLNGTINPDFSHVEADAVQLDINEPFALYFSEKRPFFMEDIDYFDSPIDAIYTRTIRDPIWGFKATGKEGANTFSSYVIQDELTNLIFPGSERSSAVSMDMKSISSVLRYKRDIGRKYTLGLLLTDREGEDYFNRVFGMDGLFRITARDIVRAQILGSSTRYPDDISGYFGQPEDVFKGFATDVFYYHNARNIDWNLVYRDFGENFRVDQGFEPQVDFRNIYLGSRYTWYPKKTNSWWKSLDLGANYSYTTNQGGELLIGRYNLYFSYYGELQSYLYARYSRKKELYNGSIFSQDEVYMYFEMLPTGEIKTWLSATYGDRIDYYNTRLGKRIRLNPGINWMLGLHWEFYISYSYEKLNIPEGHLYTAQAGELQIEYQFTKQARLKTIIQYRNYWNNVGLYIYGPPEEKEQLALSQVLFSYKVNPQTVILLGYSDNYYGNTGISLAQTDRTLFLKLGYALGL